MRPTVLSGSGLETVSLSVEVVGELVTGVLSEDSVETGWETLTGDSDEVGEVLLFPFPC